jgi:hypothetical protein
MRSPLQTTIQRIIAGALFMVCAHLQTVDARDHWPKPSVVLFDCKSSAAVTSDTTARAAINSASAVILMALLRDTSSQQVFLVSYGFADTGSVNFSASWGQSTLPDSTIVADADYVIASTIIGSPGSYALTVSLRDGASYAHIVDGTSSFGSATPGNVSTAALSALAKILPLTTYIRNYQKSLKSTSPLLLINPQIELSPAQLKLKPNTAAAVAITALDCDGSPIAGRRLTLTSTRGSFNPAVIQTGPDGKASAEFNTGKSGGAAILTATIPNAMSVTRDSIYPSGSATVFVGEVDTTKLWVLEFDIERFGTSYNDTYTPTKDGTAWEQKTTFYSQASWGKFYGESNDEHTEFSFDDTTLSVSGGQFQHSLTKYSGPNPYGESCPKKYWSMGGTSVTYVAKVDEDHQGEASFEYDPLGARLFDITIPMTLMDMYGYDWSSSGNWVNGRCETQSDFQGSHASFKMNTMAGLGFYGSPPIAGATIVPWTSGGTIVGYTINVNRSDTYFKLDGSCVYTFDRCSATLKPFTNKTTTVTMVEQPKEFFLAQNYPNPFNPHTTIIYSLPKAAAVSLRIFNALGQEVAALVNEQEGAGSYQVRWNASHVPSGVYFYRLRAGEYVGTKKMILLK